MATPTPNGPTLNDLEYGSYNQAGFVNVTTGIPNQFIGGSATPVSDAIATSENVVLNLVGLSSPVDTSDVINTAENVVVRLGSTGPNLFSITVSDTVTTTENVDVLKAGARNVNVSDSTITSENMVVTPPA